MSREARGRLGTRRTKGDSGLWGKIAGLIGSTMVIESAVQTQQADQTGEPVIPHSDMQSSGSMTGVK